MKIQRKIISKIIVQEIVSWLMYVNILNTYVISIDTHIHICTRKKSHTSNNNNKNTKRHKNNGESQFIYVQRLYD